MAQLERYLSMRLALSAAAAGCLVLLGGFALVRRLVYTKRDLPGWLLVALPLALLACFAVLYPLSQKRVTHQGSDREDALRVELVAITQHQFPYDARTFRGNPPTPLPGAMLLASPFFFLGRIAWQNLFWAPVFLYVLVRSFRFKATAALFWFAFLLLALENLNDLVVGGDYVTNILYVATAAFCCDRWLRRGVPAWKGMLSMLFLGAAISSRIPYVLIVFPLFALSAQRLGSLRAGAWLCGVLGVFLLVTLPVFSPHPVQRFAAQMHQNADKLQHLPAHLPLAMEILALAIALSSLFLKMDLFRVYLLLGLSCSVLVAPAMITTLQAEGGLGRPLTSDMEYFAMPAVLLALWAFHAWEARCLLPRPLRPAWETESTVV